MALGDFWLALLARLGPRGSRGQDLPRAPAVQLAGGQAGTGTTAPLLLRWRRRLPDPGPKVPECRSLAATTCTQAANGSMGELFMAAAVVSSESQAVSTSPTNQTYKVNGRAGFRRPRRTRQRFEPRRADGSCWRRTTSATTCARRACAAATRATARPTSGSRAPCPPCVRAGAAQPAGEALPAEGLGEAPRGRGPAGRGPAGRGPPAGLPQETPERMVMIRKLPPSSRTTGLPRPRAASTWCAWSTAGRSTCASPACQSAVQLTTPDGSTKYLPKGQIPRGAAAHYCNFSTAELQRRVEEDCT